MLYFFITTVALLIIIFHFLLYRSRKKIMNGFSLTNSLTQKEYIDSKLVNIETIRENNKNYKILIVEDDAVNRKILKAQLQSAHYQVITVTDGNSALNVIKDDNSIDIILLDLLLPDISGIEVCKKIRHQYTQFEKPVIMVTSKNKVTDLVEGFESGANDFITKPYNVYELIARINSSIHIKNLYKDITSLKKINSMRSDLVDMAAHDLKTPLTIISGYSNRIIKLTEKQSNESDLAGKILKSSNKMLNIINQMLNSSKFENFIVNFEKIDVNSVIQQTINYYKEIADDKNQKINFSSDNIENYAELDHYSFTTIIENLITNAIKYSPVESVINIKVSNDNSNLQIHIKDFGDGFTKEEMDNLFTKYFPFTNRPTKGETSTGLGLYIINNMVKKNKGTIKLNSTKGKGSEFILTFPVAPSCNPLPIQ